MTIDEIELYDVEAVDEILSHKMLMLYKEQYHLYAG